MTPTSAPYPARIIAGLSEIASGYDALLCDVWGVLHNGERNFAAAADALIRFRGQGGQVVLVTNSPRPSEAVRDQLDRLALPRETYDAIVTSGDVTIAAIGAQGRAPLHHIGPERDLALFRAVENATGHAPVLVDLPESTCVVVTGLGGDETGLPEDYDRDLAAMRRRDLPMICANPDLLVHIGSTTRYCAGAIAERYQRMGGAVLYAGKPHPPIYQASLAALSHADRPVAMARVLAIGDAMRTDVAGAVQLGFDVLFVTSGIHHAEVHRGPDGALDPDAYGAMIMASGHRPLAAIATLAW
jgi:HAD superfamily hydrolase (TIGR01459 family)